MEEIESWCKQNKIKINNSKTQAIVFQKRKMTLGPPIRIGNDRIQWSSEIKYLGLHMDKRLTWRSHIDNTKLKTRAAIFQLYPILGRGSAMSLKTKTQIIQAVTRAHN